jgi:hypothetical protein
MFPGGGFSPMSVGAVVGYGLGGGCGANVDVGGAEGIAEVLDGVVAIETADALAAGGGAFVLVASAQQRNPVE